MNINQETRHKYQKDILEISRMRHLTAEEILKEIQKKNQTAGQATIYRTIKFLNESGKLNKITHQNKSFYETQEQFHGHLIDEKKEIKDFDISEKFLKEIEEKIGKKIKGLDLKVFI